MSKKEHKVTFVVKQKPSLLANGGNDTKEISHKYIENAEEVVAFVKAMLSKNDEKK